MDGQQHNGPLENTITRIADLYTHQEAKRDMNDTTPVEQYAETATGQALADVIDELSEQHDDLAADSNGTSAINEMDRDRPARRASDANGDRDMLRDGISTVMHKMEDKLRNQVALAIEARTADLEADYHSKVNRMRELTIRRSNKKKQRCARRWNRNKTKKNSCSAATTRSSSPSPTRSAGRKHNSRKRRNSSRAS